MIKKGVFIAVFLLVTVLTYGQDHAFSNKVNWHGYTQFRFSSNFDGNTAVSLRRLKFWMNSGPGFSKHWSFKVQGTFSSHFSEKFLLQDIKVGYRTGAFSFYFGQLIPAYSLEWFQHDFLLPVIERAKVIDALTPDGTLGVRDIGAQASYLSENKLLKISLGLFNGNGIKRYHFNNRGYMLTNKTELDIPINKSRLKLGYSLQYRKADQLKIPFVLPDTVAFSGNDFRYNFFLAFQSKNFNIQGEWLHASFNGSVAYGYYLLSWLTMKRNQVVFSYEEYHDLIPQTVAHPTFRLGYDYMIKAYKVKLFFDNYCQFDSGKIINYTASLQFQFFFK